MERPHNNWVTRDGIEFMPEKNILYDETAEQTPEVINTLTPVEAQVLQLRWGLPDELKRTQAEIGTEIGVSASTVQRIEKRALKKMNLQSLYHQVDKA